MLSLALINAWITDKSRTLILKCYITLRIIVIRAWKSRSCGLFSMKSDFARWCFEVRNIISKQGDHYYNVALGYSLMHSEFIIQAAEQHKSLCLTIRDEPRWVIKGGLPPTTHGARVQTLFQSSSESFSANKLLYPCKYKVLCVNSWKNIIVFWIISNQRSLTGSITESWIIEKISLCGCKINFPCIHTSTF